MKYFALTSGIVPFEITHFLKCGMPLETSDPPQAPRPGTTPFSVPPFEPISLIVRCTRRLNKSYCLDLVGQLISQLSGKPAAALQSATSALSGLLGKSPGKIGALHSGHCVGLLPYLIHESRQFSWKECPQRIGWTNSPGVIGSRQNALQSENVSSKSPGRFE